MGYTTSFHGRLTLNKSLRPEHEAYLRRFGSIRHKALNEETLKEYSDPLREAVGLPIGQYGMYFTGIIDPEEKGYDLLSSYSLAIDGTRTLEQLSVPDDSDVSGWPPPDVLCPWAPCADGEGIEINIDKPYCFSFWLRFLNEHFLLPWGYVLSGVMFHQGEQGDHGRIIVEDKEVKTIVDGASLLARTEENPEKGEVIKVHWMTIGSISPAARKALLEAECIISDVHEDPPIVLLGIPYDCNHFWRYGQDSLDIYTMEGVLIHAKNLRLSWISCDFPGKSWGGVPTTGLVLCQEETSEYDV